MRAGHDVTSFIRDMNFDPIGLWSSTAQSSISVSLRATLSDDMLPR